MPSTSPQPNLFAAGGAAALPLRFWMLLPLVGVGGGLGGIGAGAVLAASTAGPLSALVLVAELMHRVDTMMVPLMLGVGGAARLLNPRSIYSARIHSGRARTRERAQSTAPQFADLVSDRYDVVSAAAPAVELLGDIVRHRGDRARPILVVDETGRLVGATSPEQLSRRAADNLLIETATAGDLATPVHPVPSSADRSYVRHRLAADRGAGVPVVDAESGRPIGVLRPDER
ncbi:MAG TPA: hypothetical protein VNV18_13840 [Stellaceae bacterium]|jgi:CIC family chloride channel protein|nr:hypothetical protein [Stellaceae bacterium]